MAGSTLLSGMDLLRFRTKRCKRLLQGKCTFGAERCQYSHSNFWNRRCPFFISNQQFIRYIPILCENVQVVDKDSSIVNKCTRGGDCPFAHSYEEVAYHPLVYKTVSCEDYKNGFCSVYYCPHVHGLAEKRTPESYMLPFTKGIEIPPYPNVTLVDRISSQTELKDTPNDATTVQAAGLKAMDAFCSVDNALGSATHSQQVCEFPASQRSVCDEALGMSCKTLWDALPSVSESVKTSAQPQSCFDMQLKSNSIGACESAKNEKALETQYEALELLKNHLECLLTEKRREAAQPSLTRNSNRLEILSHIWSDGGNHSISSTKQYTHEGSANESSWDCSSTCDLNCLSFPSSSQETILQMSESRSNSTYQNKEPIFPSSSECSFSEFPKDSTHFGGLADCNETSGCETNLAIDLQQLLKCIGTPANRRCM